MKHVHFKTRLLCLAWMLFCSIAFGQVSSIQIRGGFLSDSIRIGEPVEYYLVVRYPRQADVLLPDSLFTIPDFNYAGRRWFPTTTQNGISTDSAVYRLTSFSIEKVQTLALPAYVINPTDTLFHTPAADTIFLREFVDFQTDTVDAPQLPVRSNTDYMRVNEAFNYPRFLIGCAIATAMMLFIWLAFGKKIRRYLRERKVRSRLNRFKTDYERLLNSLKDDFNPQAADRIVLIWKAFLEDLEGTPYRSLTTREISTLKDHHEIRKELSSIDRMIYGRVRPENLNDFRNLMSFSEDRSYRLIERIKKGEL